MCVGQQRVLGVILTSLGLSGCTSKAPDGGNGDSTTDGTPGTSSSGSNTTVSTSDTGPTTATSTGDPTSTSTTTESYTTDDGPDTSSDDSNCVNNRVDEMFCIGGTGSTTGADDRGDATSIGTGPSDDSDPSGADEAEAEAEGGGSGTGAQVCPDGNEDELYCSDGELYAISAPFILDGQCCYTLSCEIEECGSGRPFFVDDHARVAPLRRGGQWCAALEPALVHLDAAARAQLAQAWTIDAQAEHASVASFARFALELLSVGAPPELIAAAHRAALEEVEHAQICFALASAYAGEQRAPGALAVDGSLQRSGDLYAIVRATVEEGCVGETLAAIEADAAARAASDPVVRAALARIADDEARHAALAWQTVAWALEQDGDAVRRAVHDGLQQAERALAMRVAAMPSTGGDGRLAWSTRRALIDSTWRDVLAPLVDQLVGRSLRAA